MVIDLIPLNHKACTVGTEYGISRVFKVGVRIVTYFGYYLVGVMAWLIAA